MKKILILIVAIFMSQAASQAGTENPVHNTITRQIKIPAELKSDKLNEKVNVQFRLENGKAYVIDITTKNDELRNYIAEEFHKMNFEGITEKEGTIYFVDINFRVL
ncbi:MAG TPA: hypothetical protein VF868_00810 [Bacteroidia bacterium]|jgi:hypothetical protein